MKIGIKQKLLLEALEKGSVAAISEDAQTDTSTLSLLIKSVKITVDKQFVVESSTNLLSVKYSVPIDDETGIIVKEAGCIVVPAKEIINWVKVQNEEASISLTLQKFQTPEIINTLEDVADTEGLDSSKFAIKKIGTVKIASKDVAKTSGKWELDCYDADQVASVNFEQKADKSFDLQGQQLVDGLSHVMFATLPKDHEHVLDSISIQVNNKDLYFAATDMQHCALYKIPQDGVSDIKLSKPLLIPCVLLDQISKVINKEEKLSFSYSEEQERVFISQPNLKIRLASTEKQHISKFPSIDVLLNKSYKLLTEMPKNLLNELLINSALVNNSSALFVFSKSDGTLTVKAISEDNKYKPNIKQSRIDGISKDARVVWGVSHLLNGLKVIKDDNVMLHLPDNSVKSVKITSKNNDKLIYFTMAIENPIYALENE